MFSLGPIKDIYLCFVFTIILLTDTHLDLFFNSKRLKSKNESDIDTKSNNVKNILHILCRLYNIIQDICIVEAELMLHRCGLQHILMKVNY